MKYLVIRTIFCLSIVFAMMACEDGPIGDIGPAGVQGPAGTNGVNSNVKGPTGDKGATGNQGPQGATGAAGAKGNNGPSNVFTSDWKRLNNWEFYTRIESFQRFFQSDIVIPELSKSDLDNSIILVYVRRAGRTDIVELTPNVRYTLNGDRIYFHSASENLISFQHDGFYSSSETNGGIASKLNGYQIETRITIIRGTTKN